jgi:hypothetical protein
MVSSLQFSQCTSLNMADQVSAKYKKQENLVLCVLIFTPLDSHRFLTVELNDM